MALVLAGPLLAAGAGLLVGLDAQTSVAYLLLAYLMFGAGAGLVTAPITNTALSGMPRDQSGVAGAIASTCRQTGATIGVAITGSIVAGGTGGFVGASHVAWAVLAGAGLAVLALGLASTGRRAQAGAQRVGAMLAADEPQTVTGGAAPGLAAVGTAGAAR